MSDVERTTLLSGYGAILDLKKVDYLVIDDRKLKDDSDIGDLGISASYQSEEGSAAKQAADEARWLRDQIGADSDASGATLSSLFEDQITDLGIRAARLIMDSSDPLRALQELLQNFPLHAADLAKTTKCDDADRSAALMDAVLNLASMRIEPGHSDLWLNGASASKRKHAGFHAADAARDAAQGFLADAERILKASFPCAPVAESPQLTLLLEKHEGSGQRVGLLQLSFLLALYSCTARLSSSPYHRLAST
ncbi:hypothetical protein [Sporisorium scitamineum]|nr:hypothetical protein [Sporisorium scitamineum]